MLTIQEKATYEQYHDFHHFVLKYDRPNFYFICEGCKYRTNSHSSVLYLRRDMHRNAPDVCPYPLTIKRGEHCMTDLRSNYFSKFRRCINCHIEQSFGREKGSKSFPYCQRIPIMCGVIQKHRIDLLLGVFHEVLLAIQVSDNNEIATTSIQLVLGNHDLSNLIVCFVYAKPRFGPGYKDED